MHGFSQNGYDSAEEMRDGKIQGVACHTWSWKGFFDSKVGSSSYRLGCRAATVTAHYIKVVCDQTLHCGCVARS